MVRDHRDHVLTSQKPIRTKPIVVLSVQWKSENVLVALNGDNLRLQLDDERMIQIDKRGNCRNRTEKA